MKQPSYDLFSRISRMAFSKTLNSNSVETIHEASRGWDDGDVSSAIVEDQTIGPTQEPQSKSTGLHQSNSAKQAPISKTLDGSRAAHHKGPLLPSQEQRAGAQITQNAFELRDLASLSALSDYRFGSEGV